MPKPVKRTLQDFWRPEPKIARPTEEQRVQVAVQKPATLDLEALAAVQKALSLEPSSQNLELQGDIYKALGRYPEAYRSYATIKDLSIAFRVKLAWTAFLANEIKEAVKVAHTSLRMINERAKNQAYGELLFLLAKSYAILRGDADFEVADYAERARYYYLTDPASQKEVERFLFDIYVKRGRVDLEKASYESAQFSLERAHQIDSSDLELARILGEAFEGCEKYKEAARLYCKYPDDPTLTARREALFARLLPAAKALFLEGHYSQAADQLEAADVIHPKDAQLPFLLGDVWMALGDKRKALAHYRRAQPNFLVDRRECTLFDIYLARGKQLYEQEEHASAKIFLSGAHAIVPKNLDLILILGDNFEILGDERSAYDLYTEALLLFPGNRVLSDRQSFVEEERPLR
jgi:tetratricopeptide (TPR) repeat protein